MLKTKPGKTHFIFICAIAKLFERNAMVIPGTINQIEAPAIEGITTLKPAILIYNSINEADTPKRFSSDTSIKLFVDWPVVLKLLIPACCKAIVCIKIILMQMSVCVND